MWWAAAFAVAAVSLGLRASLLLTRPLWHDERFTVWTARQPASALVEVLREDSGPPLFYLLEKAVLSAAGPRLPLEGAARAVSFLATFLLLPFASGLPRRTRPVFILLVSSFALVNLYAAEARAYALLALLSLSIFRLVHEGPESRSRLALLAAAGTAALYTHYLAIFAVLAAAATALAAGRRRSAAACLVAFALFAPWVPIVSEQPSAATAWMRESAGATLVGWISAFGGVGRIPAPFGAALAGGLVAAGMLAGLFLAWAAAGAARRDPGAFSALLFVAFALGAAALASLFRPLAFAGRSEMAVLPVWIWACARASGERRIARAAAAGASALGILATLLVATSPHPIDTAGVALRRLYTLTRPGDALIAGPGFYLAARLAVESGELPVRVDALPAGDARHPGWFVAAPPGPAEEAEVARAMEGLPPDARLFLLLPPSHATPGIMATLSSRGVVRELVRQADAVLLVWSPVAHERWRKNQT